MPYNRIQVESRVQRFERLVQCEKLVPLEALKPVAKIVLKGFHIYASRFWIEEMFSDHKSRGLNLESTRLTDPDRLERLLVAVTLAYLRIMEVGALVVIRDRWRQVDNRGAERSVSLCQIGLRWLKERQNEGFLPPLFSWYFKPLEAT